MHVASQEADIRVEDSHALLSRLGQNAIRVHYIFGVVVRQVSIEEAAAVFDAYPVSITTKYYQADVRALRAGAMHDV